MFLKTEKQQQAIQLLSSSAQFILLFGGSRSGKTAIIVYAILVRALKAAGSRHLICRKHFNKVKTSVWYDTLPKVKALAFPDLEWKENRSDWFITLPNKSEIWIGGLDDKERTEKILGTEYATVYPNECSEISYEAVQLLLTRLAQNTTLKNKMFLDCNPSNKKHWSHVLFIENKDPITNEKKNKSKYASMLINPADNKENLPDGYIDDILSSLSRRQLQRFKLGKWLDDAEGALWNQQLIGGKGKRVDKAPSLKKILVGVDPATTSGENSDETGIIVAGVGFDNHCYVLADYSGRYSPNKTAKVVLNAYDDFECDYIVAEVNQGGDYIETIIRNARQGVFVDKVRAGRASSDDEGLPAKSRAKVSRANPVLALYEQGLVHHVGVLPGLEDQQCSWVPSDKTSDSPDRIDALVWVVTKLMLQPTLNFFTVT